VNSSGISLDGRGYAGTGTSATNASITLNSNGLQISVAAPGGGGSINFSAGTTSANLALITFGDVGGVSFGLNGSVITASAPAAAASPINFSAGTTSNGLQSVVFGDANFLSFGLGTGASSRSITASYADPDNWNLFGNTAGTSASTVGTGALNYSGGNGVTLSGSSNTIVFSVATNYQSQGAYLTTARASNDAVGLNTAVSNATVTVNSSGFSFDGRNYAGTGTSATNASVTLNSNGLQISVAAGGAGPKISSFANAPVLINSSVMTWNGASISHAAAVLIPEDISFSFIRIPALFTTNSTTIATLASATATAQGGIFSTINAVFYSMGVGANSQSLQLVSSSSGGYSFTQGFSMSNSTQASHSLGLSHQANGAGTSLSTQYSISNTNYSFTTNNFTAFTSARMLDIPFAASLPAGPYWVVVGMSSSSSSAGPAGLAAITNCNVRYSAHYGMSQLTVPFGIMGSTNLTSGGLLGAGSFSTAGGGTTASINISAISSMASLALPYFQLLRSA